MRYENRTLHEITIRLDKDEVINCVLVECHIYFGGHRLPTLEGNHFHSCDFHFDASLSIALQTLRAMLRYPELRPMVLDALGLSEESGVAH